MITLSDERRNELRDALADSFDPKFFMELLRTLGSDPAKDVSPQLPYLQQIAEMIERMARDGRLEDLLRAAYEANPRSQSLRSLNEAAGLLWAAEGVVDLVRPLIGQDRVAAWTSGLDEIRQQVCSVAGDRTGGTGFLVGPAQIMTHIAVAPLDADGRLAAELAVTFVRQPGSIAPPRQYHALPEPTFVSRSGLVVLQLDREAAREIETAPGSRTSRGRGWIVPRGAAEGRAVIVVQFPQGAGSDGDLRLGVDPDGLVSAASGKLVYRTATQRGSAGAPCFDIDWRLIGIHLQHDIALGANEGVAIAGLLEELHEQHFGWDLTSGITRDPAYSAHHDEAGELDARVRHFKPSVDTADDVWGDGHHDDPSDPGRWAWAEAAAVTSTYEPEKLRPIGEASKQARARVVIESIPVIQADGSLSWVLPDGVRIRALERLSQRGALKQARAANPGPGNDSVNIALGALIDSMPIPPADRQDPARLRAILEAAGWLARTDLQLPPLAELHGDLERAKLLAPFRHLTRGFFAGRDAELARLTRYVEGPAATGGASPIFLHGSGGMGKSALIAHFILAYSGRDATRPDVERPFVYLDFDRPELDARDHLGVLLVIARQIAPQLPSLRGELDRLLEKWETRRTQARQTKRGRRTRQPALPPRPNQANELLGELAAILTGAKVTATARVLAIFDTLEEVQYATPDALPPLVDLVRELQAQLPRLRPILAGRVELDSFALDHLPLRPLPQAAAEALLSNHLPPALAIKSELIAQMIKVVGGNPLSLRLAADMLRRETVDGAHELGEEDLWQHIGDAVVQGQLYERIADHLHDEAVKKIAIPGLVLRFITPDLILRVLAGPCKVDVSEEGAPKALFDKLASETALVRQGQDSDRLSIRPDLRRTVLEGFRNDRGSTETRLDIHTAAVAYFASRTGIEDRIEEIYHRLWLGQEPHDIDARWLTGIEPGLRNAVEELDGRARLYLANRVGVAADEDISTATQDEWERYAERRASDLLQLGLAQAALAVLDARSERQPGSRLYLLESLAHAALGDRQRAELAAVKAVDAARSTRNSESIEAALDQLVQVRRQLDDTEGVLQALAELGNLGEALGDDLIQVEASTAALESVPRSDIANQTFSDTAVRTFSRLPDEMIVRAPELARRLAAQVGGDHPALLQRVVRLVGIGPLDATTATGLGDILQGWADRQPEIQPYLPRSPASAADVANVTQYLIGSRQMDAESAQTLSNWIRSLVSKNRLENAAPSKEEGMARYPGAEWMPISGSSGSFTGGPFKIVHHTTEGSSAAGAFTAFRANRSDPHFTVDENKVYQHIDTNVAARALRNASGGVQTNRDSAIQIEVVGFAHRPKSKATLRNLGRLCRWIESKHGVPKVWPNGQPKPAKNGKDPGGHNRDAHTWDTKGGHYGHSNVPENTHWDPAYTDDEVAFLMQVSADESLESLSLEFPSIPATDPGLGSDYSRMPDHSHVEEVSLRLPTAVPNSVAREESRSRLENILPGMPGDVAAAINEAIVKGRIDPARFGVSGDALAVLLDRQRSPGLELGGASRRGLESIENPVGLEAIVRRVGRPPMLIRDDRIEFETVALLPQFTEAHARRVERFIPSVGRVEFVNHSMRWGGTGFVVDEAPGGRRLVVTNRHVAKLVARRGRDGAGIFLRSPIGARYGANLDVREEAGSAPGDAFTMPVARIAFLADDSDADVALFEIEVRDGLCPDPVPLAARRGRDRELVATIGYPAFDDRNDLAQMRQYFNDLYDVKRFAPGLIMTGGTGTVLSHDCTTLGGNSGSCLLSLEQEAVVGLHFSGDFGVQNAAVSADTLKALISGQRTLAQGFALDQAAERPDGSHEPAYFAAPVRAGYDPGFLGADLEVPWPEFGEEIAADLAPPSDATENRGYELRYTHFGVLFSKSRRSPRVTASNIDGNASVRIKRGTDQWFYDLRIARELQLGQGAYSDAEIDRGHMVRREDPNWGEQAQQANDDTFHYTNSALQHSTLNQGKTLWQGLENYILDSSRTSGFRACVFTGPVFRDDDPELSPSNAQVPQEFWKIVAMPKESGGLHATGYVLSQGDLIRELLERRSRSEAVEGFVLGAYRTFQVAVGHIEEITGLRFPALKAADPLSQATDGSEAAAATEVIYLPIEDVGDIVLERSAYAPTVVPSDAGDETLDALQAKIGTLDPVLYRLVGLSETIADEDVEMSATLTRLFQIYHSEVASQPSTEETPAPDFNKLKAGYEKLFETCTIRPEKKGEVAWYVKKLTGFRPRYEKVGSALGIPWWFVGITHALEGSFNFKGHLHNGDPLTARTVQVPKGQPKKGNPPFTWETSAVDALTLKGFEGQSDWSVARSLYRFEGYNGWGYRGLGINSPYLWSYSNHHTKGKFVKDHKYDPNALSKQCGAAVMLKALGV
ncbi:UNVERIFIED_ORG: lysozyme family protein/DNA/RNA endonuclease G (NUC1)/V8-like Glu-specific endopeptidase [Rhizobium esperanzae]